ncbi:hypothetical protein [Zoogloea sp. LCSB751]|uniref:hypothetical protein n=1 Tax=Zoogloea sp. LCSB751 TaxID=1965277 RepID=UPI0009A53E19|nr:hypothetical protein [Zoogloea sp. LCSB751]
MTRHIQGSTTLLLSLSLSACGGGGGGSDDGSTAGSGGGAQGPSLVVSNAAEGMWLGTSDAGASISGVILNDGSFYAVYSTRSDKDVIGGVVTGTGQASNGSFTVKDAVDFNFDRYGVNSISVSASYFTKSSLSGVLTYANRDTSTFSTQYNPAYEQPANATLATGTYTGNAVSSAGTQTAFMTLQANGTITGVVAGCNFSGVATPRGSVNVFNLSVTFRGGSCTFGTDTLTGIGFYNIPRKQFYIAAPNTARSDGLFFQGTRP